MRSIISVAALSLALATSGAAFAQPAGGGGPPPGGGNPAFAAVRQACAADIQKFCGDIKPDDRDGRRACMQSHQNDFSAECKDAMAKMRAAMQNGPPPGGGGGGGR
jgi:hypothetical protein